MGGGVLYTSLCSFLKPYCMAFFFFFKKPLSFNIHRAYFLKAVQAIHPLFSCKADLPCCNTPSCDVLVSTCEGSPEILGRAPIFVPCTVCGSWDWGGGWVTPPAELGRVLLPSTSPPLPWSPPGGLSPQPSGSWGCFLHANSQGLFRRRGR